jgi:hypothetical protein
MLPLLLHILLAPRVSTQENHRSLARSEQVMRQHGTPFFALGDTWWALGANRFHWYDDDQQRPIGPAAGFKDYVRYRKAQGFNWINMIAAFPNWLTDGQPWRVVMDDPARTTVRSAWLEFRANSAKNMDNEGGHPFLFPGKVPGYENMFPDVQAKPAAAASPSFASATPRGRWSPAPSARRLTAGSQPRISAGTSSWSKTAWFSCERATAGQTERTALLD